MKGVVIIEGPEYHPDYGILTVGKIVELPDGFDFEASHIFAPYEAEWE